ncbi:MFS transporter [Pseudonocardia nigra]|uniref:MFS transporter n=1 Tax=Pseudonocardia nigra TaxID=1921578 RepID=UPI0027E22AEA|nr:MFS transporter [Pseudonocardia nigra]
MLGGTASVAGSQVTLVVLPVLMFQLTGSAALTGLLLAVEATPYLLFGLLAGAVADRVDRRLLMIGCDLSAAVAMASVPAAAAFGALAVPHVFAAAVVVAVAFVWRDGAYFGALPAIVGRDRLVAATGILASTAGVLQVLGPAVGGVLVATVGAPAALWLDAAGYLVSAATLLLIRAPFATGPAGERRRILADIAEGLRFVRRHPLIRPLSLMGFGHSLTGGALIGLLVVYGVERLDLGTADPRLGWLYSAGAIGALCAAALLRGWCGRSASRGWTCWSGPRTPSCSAESCSRRACPSRSWPSSSGWGTYQLAITSSITLRQQLTPDRLQGRVNVTARMIAWGGQPVGAALGGALAEAWGLRTALLVAGIGAAGAAVYGWLSPLRRPDATAPGVGVAPRG